MSAGPTAPASLPPPGFPGLEPHWSRLITTPGLDGAGRTWHILDNQVANPALTVLCVHGNPTWSYLWRDLISTAPSDVRVIAVDQLDMGYSERTGTTRRLAQRVDDVCALTAELHLAGPVVTVGHDWGGPVSLGWATQHREQLAGIVLTNTAVHQPPGSPAPRLIRLVRNRWVLRKACVSTSLFIHGALALTRPRLTRTTRRAFAAPYSGADRRAAIATFVEDIPLRADHPSRPALDTIAADLDRLADIPSLLLWGPSDPVFGEVYLRDLAERLPRSEIHRFSGASHLVTEDPGAAPAIHAWVNRLGDPGAPPAPVTQREPLWAELDRRAGDGDVAVVEMGPAGRGASVSFADLNAAVEEVAAGLSESGVAKGDRVALLIPPGIDLAVCIYACWRMGAVVVVADAGLGARGMTRALVSANPAYLIGNLKALAAARTLRWPGTRISTAPVTPAMARLLEIATTLEEVRRLGEGRSEPPAPDPLDRAAVAFTSGATGPAKGVVYRHHQLQAQRDALVDLYGITREDRLVAAFGPFALYGPAMGIPSVVPDMEVTAPGTLTGRALSEAVEAIEATLVFASPAALKNVAATADGISPDLRAALDGVRLVMSAGAPVPPEVLRSVVRLMPSAEAHTPYGMTEVLPVADISLADLGRVGSGNGVCVGYPGKGVEVTISPLDATGGVSGPPTTDAEVIGEVCIRAPHMRDGYDKLWWTQHAASQPQGWHRSGDVGHLDEAGRLWIEGRIGHIITTAGGVVTPVGIEHAVSDMPELTAAAAVGIGPAGTQQVVIVVVPVEVRRRPDLAGVELSDRVRSRVANVDVAAVLTVPALPVDKRHNSKIDRSGIARWAAEVLAGGRMGQL